MHLNLLKEKLNIAKTEMYSSLLDKDLLEFLEDINLKNKINTYKEDKNKELLEYIVVVLTLNMIVLNRNEVGSLHLVINCLLNKEIEKEKTEDYLTSFFESLPSKLLEQSYMKLFLEEEIKENKEIYDFLFNCFKNAVSIKSDIKRAKIIGDYITIFKNDKEKLVTLIKLLENCKYDRSIRDVNMISIDSSRDSLFIMCFINRDILELITDSYYEGMLKEFIKPKNDIFHYSLLSFIKKNQKFNIEMLRILFSIKYLDNNLTEVLKFENFKTCFDKNKTKLKILYTIKSKEMLNRVLKVEEALELQNQMINF